MIYTKNNLQEFSEYLISMDFVYVGELIKLCQYNEDLLGKGIEIVLESSKDLYDNREGIACEVWRIIRRAFFTDFKDLPTLIGRYEDLPKEIMLWRLARGI